MSAPNDTLRAPPLWAPPWLAWARFGSGILAAVVATVLGAVVVQTITASNQAVAQRLTVIESKLDGWRDEQHSARARVEALERDREAVRSNLRALDDLVAGLRRELAARGERAVTVR